MDNSLNCTINGFTWQVIFDNMNQLNVISWRFNKMMS